ncbi:hypothetical protein EDC35_10431 [Thiobaca trueperi]|uniref:Uncharacterized protein n=2 Tax=Thiobaca trueperi TaxID=127458 RepID=A0A4R3MX59_9GAMM|nr:hypothetical protein EDC35_10431 [Thiobaca trueperi]
MNAVDPGYLNLRAAGYRWDNCGVMLGDRPRDPNATTYGTYAPNGALIGYARGMCRAYRLALEHWRRSDADQFSF